MPDYQSRSKAYRWAYDKEYSLKHRQTRLERAKRWNASHKDIIANRQREKNAKLREEMLTAYGKVCRCCGETTTEFLSIDHIERNGQDHRKELGGRATSTYSFLVALRRLGWPTEGIQILCMNCNFATRYGKLCPHKAVDVSRKAAVASVENFRLGRE